MQSILRYTVADTFRAPHVSLPHHVAGYLFLCVSHDRDRSMSKASNEFKSVPYLQEVGMTEEVTFYDDELTELIRTIEARLVCIAFS